MISSSKVVVILWALIGTGLTADSSFRCDDGWVQLSREKCYKVIKDPMTREEASKACDDSQGAYASSLLSVKSRVEARILQRYLYNQLYITGSVWLNAQRDNTSASFLWADGSGLRYNNWDNNRPSKDKDSNCVQFNPRTIKWTDTSCDDKVQVVCQKLQMWTFPELLEEFLDWRQDVDERIEELEEEIEERDQKIDSLENRLDDLSNKYNNFNDKFENLKDELEDKVKNAVDKLEDQNDKLNDKISDLDKKYKELSDALDKLEDQCSDGCSGGNGNGGNGGASDEQIERLRKELKEEIEKKIKPIGDKVDNSVTDARLEIISWRRTLQIEKKGKWISLGHV